MGIFWYGDTWPIYDQDGVIIGLMCGHLADRTRRHRIAWEQWRALPSGDDYLWRVCDECQRDVWRRRHARKHRK